MAKGKRATALFEVIQAAKAREDKRLNKANRGNTGLHTPSWWFKSKNKNNGSTVRSEPIVSVEIPPAAIRSAATCAAASQPPQGKEAKRASLISSLLSRKSADPVKSESQRSESQRSESPRPESTRLESAQRESSQLASTLFNSDDESTTESSTSVTSESAAETPAQPMMRLTDDMVDNEEALEFTEPAPATTAATAATTAAAEISSPQIIESTVMDEPSSSEDEQSAESSDVSASEPQAQPAVIDHKPVKLAVDRHRQQLNLRITYTSAAIGAFGFIAVIGMAFIIGKSLTHGPAGAGAASIEGIRNGKVFPKVLEVTRNSSSAPEDGSTVKTAIKPTAKQPTANNAVPAGAKIAPAPTPVPSPNNSQANSHPNLPTAPASASPQNQPAQPAAFNGRRIVGMQYVWVQSYPDPEDANDAVGELKKAGIDATAEKVAWLAHEWTVVLGTRAFDHAKNNPDYDSYLHSILAVSDGFGGGSKFKKFDPSPVRWREQQH